MDQGYSSTCCQKILPLKTILNTSYMTKKHLYEIVLVNVMQNIILKTRKHLQMARKINRQKSLKIWSALPHSLIDYSRKPRGHAKERTCSQEFMTQ